MVPPREFSFREGIAVDFRFKVTNDYEQALSLAKFTKGDVFHCGNDPWKPGWEVTLIVEEVWEETIQIQIVRPLGNHGKVETKAGLVIPPEVFVELLRSGVPKDWL